MFPGFPHGTSGQSRASRRLSIRPWDSKWSGTRRESSSPSVPCLRRHSASVRPPRRRGRVSWSKNRQSLESCLRPSPRRPNPLAVRRQSAALTRRVQVKCNTTLDLVLPWPRPKSCRFEFGRRQNATEHLLCCKDHFLEPAFWPGISSGLLVIRPESMPSACSTEIAAKLNACSEESRTAFRDDPDQHRIWCCLHLHFQPSMFFQTVAHTLRLNRLPG